VEFVSMLARGGVDDDSFISTIGTDFSHATTMTPEPSSGLRGIQIDVQTVAFDVRRHPQS